VNASPLLATVPSAVAYRMARQANAGKAFTSFQNFSRQRKD